MNRTATNVSLKAGAAAVDITPEGSVFLFGYPHVPRMSNGVHDRLLSSALFLSNGATSLLLVANDVIFISKAMAARVRRRVESELGVPASHVVVAATHTHSGPKTADMLSNESDTVVPATDSAYVAHLENAIVEAARQAVEAARPVELGFVVANGSCVGGNRHDPAGPANAEVPVLVARDAEDHTYRAAMVICSMHPTVLHEDSTRISGDFPAMTRRYLQSHVFGETCTILHMTGPCGNQSPRHVARENTFAEAERLGTLLGKAVEQSLAGIAYRSDLHLACISALVDLPRRRMPSHEEARRRVQSAAGRLAQLRAEAAPRGQVRTAECDFFGAEETLALARAAEDGRLASMTDWLMPAELTALQIGPWQLVAWPGETYVEFALQLKAAYADLHVISLANGELQGYLVTEEAVRQQHYEANNALFSSPESGELLVARSLELLGRLRTQRGSACP